jgi:hypothetical protein
VNNVKMVGQTQRALGIYVDAENDFMILKPCIVYGISKTEVIARFGVYDGTIVRFEVDEICSDPAYIASNRDSGVMKDARFVDSFSIFDEVHTFKIKNRK